MVAEPSHFDGAATRFYQGYRYTIVTIVNGAQPHTQEAELWWQRMNDAAGKWHYFRRYISAQAREAERRAESDFKEWVEGRQEADG